MNWELTIYAVLGTMLLSSTLCLVMGAGRAINRKRRA